MSRFGSTDADGIDLSRIGDWADIGREVRELADRAARESIEIGPNVRGGRQPLPNTAGETPLTEGESK